MLRIGLAAYPKVAHPKVALTDTGGSASNATAVAAGQNRADQTGARLARREAFSGGPAAANRPPKPRWRIGSREARKAPDAPA